MDQQEERLRQMEQRFKTMIEDIDKSYLRKIQGDMHRCAANCCDNETNTMEKTQNCVENCSTTLENAQRYVQSEIGRFQNRWTRCIMECNDKMRDNMAANKSKSLLGDEFEKCASDCVQTQCNLMLTIGSTMKKALAGGQYDGHM